MRERLVFTGSVLTSHDRLEMYDADLNVLRAEACQVIAKKM